MPSLHPGSRVGPYEIREAIGAGGMGRVFRARDTTLNRDVALKVVSDLALADADPTGQHHDAVGRTERLARLRREATLLASLNHPNVASIHGLENLDGSPILVLEFVEGTTLRERLARGPLDPSEALSVASQVAAALEAAHERGIVHRDLKPANVIVTPDGRVKVLDFGLGKHVGPAPVEAADDVTRTALEGVHVTRQGAVMGTAAYMSPEQARGQAVDRRTDIWAFGCLLFEMLAGRSPFSGDTPSDTLVHVLDREPDWSLIAGRTPPAIATLVRRCLRKDERERLRDIGDARLEIEAARVADVGSRTPVPRGRAAGRRTALVAGATLVLAVLGLSYLGMSDGAGPIDSIAVLPFESRGADPDSEYLGEGITESLINRLSTVPGLRVVPRGIAYQYRGRTTDLETAGVELGVRAIVTGRVDERDGTLIVRTELTDVGRVAQIWGQQYSRPLSDLLEIEDDLVRQISQELRLRLTPEDRARLVRHPTENAEAYRLFLRAHHHILSFTPRGLDLGLEYAREAVALDPGYGLGHAALADAYFARTVLGLDSSPAGYERARQAAARAVALDDVHAYPRLMMGFVRHHVDWDWAGAAREFERALELEPESPDAHQSYSEALVSLGRMDEALEHAERAIELDPVFPLYWGWLAIVHRYSRNSEDALRAAESALELAPENLLAQRTRGQVLLALGRFDEGIEALARLVEAQGGSPDSDPLMAEAYAWAGRLDEARARLDRLSTDDVPSGSLVTVARVTAELGDLDTAFEILERAYEVRSTGLLFFGRDPRADVFGDDPRLDAFLRRMGFE